MTFKEQSHSAAFRKPGEEHTGVLVVDSDPGVRWSLEKGLTHSGYQVKSATTPEHVISLVQGNGIAAILMEIMPEAGFTLDLLSRIMSFGHPSVVLCSSVDPSPQLVMECVWRGAAGFLSRPFGLGEVRAELSRTLVKLRHNVSTSSEEEGAADQEPSLLVGVSHAIQELRATICQVAQTDMNCLIRGESGVGKDVVAREIHRLSPRRNKPFVKVNCSALPENLLESELFGYEKGAFTGAIAPKPGRFSLADKGTIFLDEICDVPMGLQAKLLQVIEHKEFTKLGGRASVKVDVQIIAATNAHIEQRTEERLFRNDLFFRLNEVCLHVPPLAERKEDIPLLARHFIQKHLRTDIDTTPNLSNTDVATLCGWNWPGNVRELESAIKRWLTLGEMRIGPASYPPNGTARRRDKDCTDENSAEEAEAASSEKVIETLEKCQWNRRKAAQMLGMSYQSLRRRITKDNLTLQG